MLISRQDRRNNCIMSRRAELIIKMRKLKIETKTVESQPSWMLSAPKVHNHFQGCVKGVCDMNFAKIGKLFLRYLAWKTWLRRHKGTDRHDRVDNEPPRLIIMRRLFCVTKWYWHDDLLWTVEYLRLCRARWNCTTIHSTRKSARWCLRAVSRLLVVWLQDIL